MQARRDKFLHAFLALGRVASPHSRERDQLREWTYKTIQPLSRHCHGNLGWRPERERARLAA